MASSIFSLLGVIVGVLLTFASAFFNEWWSQRRTNKKSARYLAVLVSCELKWYMVRCAEVTNDDGLSCGLPNKDECLEIQVKTPKFDPKSFDVEWKSLPANLMDEILDLPYKAEIADSAVSSAFDIDCPPYNEGFEERQLQYAILGITASQLVEKLRKHAKLSTKDVGVNSWDPVQQMKDRKFAIESRRAKMPNYFVS